jgi:hypothetical protein
MLERAAYQPVQMRLWMGDGLSAGMAWDSVGLDIPGMIARRVQGVRGSLKRSDFDLAKLRRYAAATWAAMREDGIMDDDEIRRSVERSLERLGHALSTGDLKGVSACWAFPAMFLSEADAMVLAEPSQLEQLMAQAIAAYRERGIASTSPELEHVDPLGETLIAVDVRWPSSDAVGREVASERSHYLLHIGKDGQARLRVALTRTR